MGTDWLPARYGTPGSATLPNLARETDAMTHTLRADLHVHTRYSMQNSTMPFLRARDCYSTPEEVYRVAKARGMDLVAITDHDSIDGALELLDRRPDADDVIVGEEVTCWLQDSRVEVHIGVYGMTESLHRDVQALSRNVFEVTARLREAGVLFALNHLLHFYRGQVPLDVYLRLLDEVPALEVRNGAMLPAHNELNRAACGAVGAGPRNASIGCGGRERRAHAEARRADVDLGAR